MKVSNLTILHFLATLAGLMLALPSQADRERHHGGHHERHGGYERHGDYEDYERDDDYRYPQQGFNDNHRTIVNNYYIQEYNSGHCPPGLAKRHNGCVPPGQRQWVLGRPLPQDVVVYELPPAVISQISIPMPGYRYVRVANDVLMLSVGTGIVMDAIRDLGGINGAF
ncbi:hypothetical protein JCM14076_16270 [Methylosoma difficile]